MKFMVRIFLLHLYNNLCSEISFFCSIIYSYEISAATGTTINSNAREYLVRHELVNSKKSQGLRGSGGGANIVRQPRTVKSNAVSLIQVLSFYLSVCISFIVFLVFML